MEAAEDTEGVSDDVLAWLSMDEDAVSQLMELLEDDGEKSSVSTAAAAAAATTAKVRFIEDPYSSPLIFQSSTSYVTINGNEESCGSSFSDSDSSVMASVDMGGMLGIGRQLVLLGACGEWSSVGGGAWGSSEGTERGWAEAVESAGSVFSGEGEAMDSCDVFDWDDQMLERFLGEDFEQ